MGRGHGRHRRGARQGRHVHGAGGRRVLPGACGEAEGAPDARLIPPCSYPQAAADAALPGVGYKVITGTGCGLQRWQAVTGGLSATTTATTIEVVGLRPDTTYQFAVVATCGEEGRRWGGEDTTYQLATCGA